MSSDKQTTQIIRSVKEILQRSLDNPNELSKLIDSYLIPLATEKKKNAEVSTPYQLRQDMLNKIPADFWKTPKKVFEPCVGKGGFLVDIYSRFMDGLRDLYPDIEERKRVISEQCLYFSDINPTNIYIDRLLIDPYSKYNLNVNEGDTLKLNIQEKWGIDGFDAVIGNPPFENLNASGDNKLYLEFTKFSLNILYEEGVLLFITPTTIIDYIITMNKNRNYIDKFYDIQYISLNTPRKYFNVNSTFTYFLMMKQEYTGNTIIEYSGGKEEITLKKGMMLPNRPSKVDLKIIEKITSLDKNYEIKRCKFSNKTQRIRSQHIKNNVISETQTELHKYKIYDTMNKSQPNGVFYYYDKLDNDCNEKRIIMSNKGYLMPFINDKNDVTYSDNFSYILYEENLLDLLNSKILKYLIFQFSKNGFDRVNCVRMIRKVELFSDIYFSFNLTDEEINVIENL